MNHIKRIFLLFPLIILTACSFSIEKNIGKSDDYSKKDIENAISVLEKEYEEFLSVGRPIVLTFNQETSDRVLKDYSVDLKKDLIVLDSDIRTNLFSGSLSPLSVYKNFYWILEKEEDRFKIIHGGFLN
ncbi:hypothetical protein DOK67_0003084 [Enterococcus sp. DIV0212c]|uniref:hypothetical protein n=1 Tax=Enterococcus sp. DIV0212c TaxID=2230867 RepID=UPI001A9ADA3D|nr:hypothetical protein [Enterococcus sp. DIV0212c]MBO1353214.1 hypothetical protein [Enterococcus sp. DIV0212c]